MVEYYCLSEELLNLSRETRFIFISHVLGWRVMNNIINIVHVIFRQIIKQGNRNIDVFIFRLSRQLKWSQSADVMFEGSEKLLVNGELNSGADLASLFVEVNLELESKNV